MKKNIDAKIASLIVLAQIASDSGKGLCRLDASGLCSKSEIRRAQYFDYSIKTEYIKKTIKIICQLPKGSWRFWCVNAPDQNGYDSVITYFEFRQNGEKFQISFHTPKGCTKEIKQYIGKGQPMYWKKRISSVDACKKLINKFS